MVFRRYVRAGKEYRIGTRENDFYILKAHTFIPVIEVSKKGKMIKLFSKTLLLFNRI
jgi:hypothetical protein